MCMCIKHIWLLNPSRVHMDVHCTIFSIFSMFEKYVRKMFSIFKLVKAVRPSLYSFSRIILYFQSIFICIWERCHHSILCTHVYPHLTSRFNVFYIFFLSDCLPACYATVHSVQWFLAFWITLHGYLLICGNLILFFHSLQVNFCCDYRIEDCGHYGSWCFHVAFRSRFWKMFFLASFKMRVAFLGGIFKII